MATGSERRLAAACPCESGDAYSKCCRPFHLRVEVPTTACQLMRSRYAAYAKGLVPYLEYSWHPDHRPSGLDLDTAQRWTGLRIIECTGGEAEDATGTVEFIAEYVIGDQAGSVHEVSRFERVDGRWVYTEPAVPA